jgi:methionine-rich copper-binding protein CopC
MENWMSQRPVTGTLALVLLAATPASAHHRFLKEAFPSAKSHASSVDRVRLVFEGRVDAIFSSMRLLDAGGRLVAEMAQPKASKEMVMPTSTLLPGAYLLEYRVLAADGDVVKGDLFFTVETQNSQTQKGAPNYAAAE